MRTSCEGENVIVIHAPKRLTGTGLSDGRAEATEHIVCPQRCSKALEVLEIRLFESQLRM